MIRLTEAERQLVLGALDSLATALADHEHGWSIGEKTIYEQATEILGAKIPHEFEEKEEDAEGEKWKE